LTVSMAGTPATGVLRYSVLKIFQDRESGRRD